MLLTGNPSQAPGGTCQFPARSTSAADQVRFLSRIVFATAILIALTIPVDAQAQAGPLQFVSIAPCRVADTRGPVGILGGPSISGGNFRSFPIPQSACSIPSTAAAYSLNVTAIPQAAMYLTLWPSGQTQPGVSNLNSDGRIKANAAIIAAGTGGAISIYASATSDVILDINGYFISPGATTGLEFYPLAPCRVVNTLNANGPLGGPYLLGNEPRTFPLQSGTCGIPSTAQAYSLNLAAVPRGSLGWLSIWPTGRAWPGTSSLSATTAITANAAIVKVGSAGSIDVLPLNDTDLIIDIAGYFAPPSSGPAGLSLYPIPECRAFNSYNQGGAFTGTIPINIQGSPCGIPANARGLVLNAAAIPSVPLGYLLLWPNGQSLPPTSTLNASDGAVTSNMAVVASTNGWINAYASQTTNLILDVFSYFGPSPLTIRTTALPPGFPGIAYSTTLDAGGGLSSYSWTIPPGSLPNGLTLNTSTGVISGTPIAPGTSTFTVQAVDGGSPQQTATKTLSIAVIAALGVTTSSLSNAYQNEPYYAAITATGGTPPYSWSVSAGQLPSSISLTTAGAIRGVPTTIGASNFTVLVTDAASYTAAQPLTLMVSAETAPAISSLSPSVGPVGTYVTVLGSHFGATQGNSAVNYNGNAVSALKWSNSAVVFVVPAGATPGTVTLTVGSQQSNSAPFTVQDAAACPAN